MPMPSKLPSNFFVRVRGRGESTSKTSSGFGYGLPFHRSKEDSNWRHVWIRGRSHSTYEIPCFGSLFAWAEIGLPTACSLLHSTNPPFFVQLCSPLFNMLRLLRSLPSNPFPSTNIGRCAFHSASPHHPSFCGCHERVSGSPRQTGLHPRANDHSSCSAVPLRRFKPSSFDSRCSRVSTTREPSPDRDSLLLLLLLIIINNSNNHCSGGSLCHCHCVRRASLSNHSRYAFSFQKSHRKHC